MNSIGFGGKVGATGATGASGTTTTTIAGEALGGNRAIILNSAGLALYANSTNATHLGKLAGVTIGAAIMGAAATFLNRGLMIEPSWGWSPDAPVYLSTTGLLTQVVPVTGFLQVVGIALSSTSLFISIREPFILS